VETDVTCPICTMPDILNGADGTAECVTCGHEWQPETGDRDEVGEVHDANGNLLHNGDTVSLIKDLKLKGSSTTLKVGTKITNIRLVAGDHQVDGKADGRGILLKAEFLKKV
jgi:protein PhnA